MKAWSVLRGRLYAQAMCCALLTLGVVAAGNQGVAWADQPPPGGYLDDHTCEKELVCSGDASAGDCLAAGIMCASIDCYSQSSNCSYRYEWDCVSGTGYCEHASHAMRIAPDCGSKCVSVAWNSCQCQCIGLGTGTVETGVYWQCYTREGIPTS